MRFASAATLIARCLATCLASDAFAQSPTAFTYQGELQNSGSPASGLHDVRFRLYDAASAGTQLGATLCVDNVSLVNGRFLVQLDFGSQFASPGRFLELDVRADTGAACNGSVGFVTLGPRQAITSVPAASFAQTAATATTAASATTATTASNASNLNGQPASFYQAASNLTGLLADARLSTNVPRLNAANTFTSGVSAPTFTGALNGNASSATTATTASNATNLNGQPASFYTDASSIAAGTLADARLSTNIPRLNAASATFTGNLFSNGSGSFGTGLQSGGTGVAAVNPNAVLAGAQLIWLADQATLRVTGAGTGVTNGLVIGTAGSTTAMKLSNVGDLGVGTTTPEARLHVLDGSAGTLTASTSSSAVFERSGNNYLQLFSPAANEKGIAFGSPTSSFQAGVYYQEGATMSFRTGGNSGKLFIQDDGNVGVGTSAPTEKLHVAGNLRVDGNIIIPQQTRTISLHHTAFVPDRSTTAWSRASSGLRATTTDTFSTPLNLPDGAEIVRLTALYIDSSTSNISVRLQRLIFASGNESQVAVTSSAGGPTDGPFTSTTTTISNGVVDNAANAYLVDAFIQSTAPDTTLALYAVQVQYRITSPLP
jgi:hypothetical protein